MTVVSDVIMAGTNAARPAASSSNDGYLYFETDTLKTFRSNGTSWVQIADANAAVGTFIKADGSVNFTADQSMNSHKLTGVTDPTGAQDAATKNYVDGIAANLGKRTRVRAATTANITISTALNNGDTLDGVTLATGDLVLVKNQSAGAENGIYVVGVTPARFAEYDTYDEHPGSLIAVEEGTTNADTVWLCTSNLGGVLDTTAITFSALSTGGSVATDSIWDAKGDLAVGTGANTASRLAVGTNGHVLTADSAEATGVKWAAGGGGGTLLKTIWNPDAPPASAGSADDEFVDGSGGVPGGWTEYDPNSVLTVDESNTYKHLILTCADRTGFNPTGIYKSIPAGNFTIWAKYGFRSPGSNYTVSGLTLWEDGADVSKKIIIFGLSPRAAATRLGIYDYTNSTTFSAETVFYFADYPVTSIYVMIRRNSTNYYYSWSPDGLNWLHDTTAHNPSFTPTHFGLALDNANTGVTIASSTSFFRYVASDVGLTGILAGQLAGIYQ